MRDDLLEYNPNCHLIAEKINELLKNKKYSTLGLAKHCGVTDQAVRDWRKQKKNIGSDKLPLVADYFGMDQKDILPCKNELLAYIIEKKNEKKKAEREKLKRLS